MKNDLISVLRELHRLDVPFGMRHVPQPGVFEVWLGEEDAALARRAFKVEELDEAAGWIVETVRALHKSAKSEPESLWFTR